jgi:uncharacterized protein YbcI
VDSAHTRGEALAAISNGLTHLHMQFYGRGPTKAKTHLVDDLVICVLWNGFTTVEKTLIEQGEAEAVKAFRHTFQQAMEGQFVEIVERATGQAVSAYMSQVHVEPDLAVDLFLLSTKAADLSGDDDEDADRAV